MFRTTARIPKVLGLRPLGSLRARTLTQQAGGPSGTEPTPTIQLKVPAISQSKVLATSESSAPGAQPLTGTSDLLWNRLGTVEQHFSELLKHVYAMDGETKANIASLKGGMKLVGWQLSALAAAAIGVCSALGYLIDKTLYFFDRFVPVEKNLLPTPPPPVYTPTSTPSTKAK